MSDPKTTLSRVPLRARGVSRQCRAERTSVGEISVPEHVAGKPLRQTEQPLRSIHRPTAPAAAA
eukprot:4102394-Pleurochrysis_carterae.AAC.1